MYLVSDFRFFFFYLFLILSFLAYILFFFILIFFLCILLFVSYFFGLSLTILFFNDIYFFIDILNFVFSISFPIPMSIYCICYNMLYFQKTNPNLSDIYFHSNDQNCVINTNIASNARPTDTSSLSTTLTVVVNFPALHQSRAIKI